MQAPNLFGVPFLLLDYRGMGRSGTLICDSLKKGIASPFEVRSCMKQVGSRSRFYSTEFIARDLDIIRTALGIPSFSLFSVSYGTLVAQTHTALFPQRVRSIVLDSPVPLNEDPWGQLNFPSYSRIIGLKSTQPSFEKSQLRRNLNEVLRLLRTSPRIRRQPKLNGRNIFEIYRTANVSLVVALLSAAKDGNFTALMKLRAILNEDTQPPSATKFSVAAFMAVSCNDLVSTAPWRPSADLRERSDQLWRSLYHDVPRNAFAPFNRVEAFDQAIQGCTGFPYPQLSPVTLQANTSVPVLALYGEQDAITPLENAVDLQAVFKENIALIGNTGHNAAFNLCTQSLVAEFFTSNSVRNV